MRETDVELPLDPPWPYDAPCLLTGEPAELRPVKLRRMLFLFVVWVGEDATVALPLAESVVLVHWQVLRMLRPTLGLMLSFPLLLSLMESDASGAVRLAATVGPALAVWFVLGLFLDRVEPVRLVGVSRDRRWLTLRFRTPAMADRARTSLRRATGGRP